MLRSQSRGTQVTSDPPKTVSQPAETKQDRNQPSTPDEYRIYPSDPLPFEAPVEILERGGTGS